MFLAIEVNKTETVKEVFNKFNANLETADFPKNPYINSKIHDLNEETYLLELYPIYANFGIYIFILGLIPLIFNILIATIIISGLGLLMMGLQTEHFVYYIIKRSLRKKGYEETIRKIPKDEIIKILWKKADLNN